MLDTRCFQKATNRYLYLLPASALIAAVSNFGFRNSALGFAFAVPAFRLLYKVHKSELGFRPITGSHCWVTQPLALLIATMLLPYCQATSSHVSDTDSFQRRLSSAVVGPHDILVTSASDGGETGAEPRLRLAEARVAILPVRRPARRGARTPRPCGGPLRC